MSDTYFKKYTRGSREQYVEAKFTDGIMFTRSPLVTGKSRLLINYDIINSGEALAVRKGYKTSSVGLALNSPGLEPKLDSNISITQGRDAVEEDNKHYRLIVANKFSEDDEALTEANLRAAQAELWVLDTSLEDKYKIFENEGIAVKDMYAIPLSYELDDSSQEKPKSYYHVPTNVKVHGIALDNPIKMARPVGTFAFGDDYYNFNTKGQLLRSRYVAADEEEHTNATYIVEKLDTKTITASEATTSGFNMLLDNPYVFHDKFAEGKLNMEGIMLYDAAGKMITEPLLNTKYKVRLFYSVQSGIKYKFVWQYRDKDSDNWIELETHEKTSTSSTTQTEPLEESVLNFSCPVENAIIRVQAYKYSGSAYETVPEAFLGLGVTYVKTPSSTTANKELINYDLSKATGIVYWKNMLWLYGLAQDPTVLFASDINEPTYFPYPNNTDIFDEPIITCVPFNDNLLVFTRSQLLQLTLSSDGGWTRKVLQSNLNFSDIDGRFVQVVKNMVFFKSGEYYYMIVPKTLSLQNELAIAPVSKNIEYFLDEFKDIVPTIADIMYDYHGELKLIDHYNFLNYEDVHNVYTFILDDGLYINLVLLYNTVSRTWRFYLYESEESYAPLKQDATKLATLMAPVYFRHNDKILPGVQFIDNTPTDVSDFYIPKSKVILYKTENSKWFANDLKGLFEAQHKYKNYTVLDTGYRDNASDYNKRFRELQFKFTNVDSTNLKFTTEFILDGDTRIGRYAYTTEHIVDPSSPNYGLLYVDRTLVENLEVPGATILAEEPDDINAWSLDASRFPEIAFWKARLKVSGKGYTPRFRLISKAEERYELLGYVWVYRQLYSR